LSVVDCKFSVADCQLGSGSVCSLTSKNAYLKNYLDAGFLPIYNDNMLKRSRKSQLDVNLLAKSIIYDCTAEKLLDKAVTEGKNPAAVLLGRLGGLKGGKARAIKLSAKKRKTIAIKAAKVRWQGKDLEIKP
jgi:hypothetical protein